jgi:hypothetical protein
MARGACRTLDIMKVIEGHCRRIFGGLDKSVEEQQVSAGYPERKKTHRGHCGGRKHRKEPTTTADCGKPAGRASWALYEEPNTLAGDCFECLQERHEKQLLDEHLRKVAFGFAYRYRRGTSHGKHGRQAYKDHRLGFASCGKTIAPIIAELMTRQANLRAFAEE